MVSRRLRECEYRNKALSVTYTRGPTCLPTPGLSFSLERSLMTVVPRLYSALARPSSSTSRSPCKPVGGGVWDSLGESGVGVDGAGTAGTAGTEAEEDDAGGAGWAIMTTRGCGSESFCSLFSLFSSPPPSSRDTRDGRYFRTIFLPLSLLVPFRRQRGVGKDNQWLVGPSGSRPSFQHIHPQLGRRSSTVEPGCLSSNFY